MFLQVNIKLETFLFVPSVRDVMCYIGTHRVNFNHALAVVVHDVFTLIGTVSVILAC